MRDPGLQNERTALAWTRSILATLAVCLVVARVTADKLPIFAITLAAAALAAAAIALGYVHQRYERAAAAVAGVRAMADGRAAAALMTLVILLGLGGIVLVLAG